MRDLELGSSSANGCSWDLRCLAQPAWAPELDHAWKSVWVPESDCALEPARHLLGGMGLVPGDIPELGLVSGVHGIWEWGSAIRAVLLLPPGWASESDSSPRLAWSAGRRGVLAGSCAGEQG